MSSRAKLVQINRSMIILDPATMPINLGHSGQEDAPEQSFPCLAYDGHNVLPTALGYQSYFSESTTLDIQGPLAELKVQHIFHYQTVNMRTISIALCEEGIYIANASEGTSRFDWQQAVGTGDLAQEGVRRVWTFCVISNKLYMYIQGYPVFFALVNTAEYQDTNIPPGIGGDVFIEQRWYSSAVETGILQYRPNFLDLAGQVGIFKAGNRLGFWDSENAVAWSSATQVYDFIPSTTTFAGITTFTDVVGTITSIRQHGGGFLIYATRSITLVSPLTGSPERWSGRAIFSDVGVVFDTQVAVAQPDSIHYAITSGGLCRISNGSPEYLEVEVMDYVRKNNAIYGLSFIDSRWIFIHGANEFTSSLPILTLVDLEGDSFEFPPPGGPYTTWPEDVLAFINSRTESQQTEFTTAMEKVTEGFIKPTANEALLPCWDVKILDTNFSESAIPNSSDYRLLNDLKLPSILSPAHTFDRTPTSSPTSGWAIMDKAETDAYYYDVERDRTDVGPEEFYEQLNEETARVLGLQAVSVEIGNQLGSIEQRSGETRQSIVMRSSTPATAAQVLQGKDRVAGVAVSNVIAAVEGKVTDCGIQLLGQLADLEATMYMTTRTEQILNVFTSMSVSVTTGTASSPGSDETIRGAFKIAIAYVRNGDYYGINQESADIFAAAMSKEPVQGLNWDDRVGQPVRVTNPVTPWFSAASLSPNGPYRAIPVSVIGGTFGSRYWYEVTNTTGPGVPGARVARILGLGPAPVYSRPISESNPPGPNDDCVGDPYETGYPQDVAVAKASPENAVQILEATQATAVRSGQFNGAICQLGGILTRNGEYVRSGIYTYVEANNSILNLTPQQITDQLMAKLDLQVNSAQQVQEVRSAILQAASNTPKMLSLLNYTMEVEKDLNTSRFPTKRRLFEAEVTGYGYYPKGGFSFRKTHRRSIFKPCGYASAPRVYTELPPVTGDIEKDLGTGGDGSNLTPTPPYSWDYPEPIRLPGQSVLFREGTLSPYYPTWVNAVVLDTHLNKWGRYNNNHKLVYSLLPINRTDQTIVPTQSGLLRGGSLNLQGACTIFGTDNPSSRITYGRIGDYRLGWTRATKIVAQFGYAANCYIIAEASLNGITIEEGLSQAATADSVRRTDMPFILAGKWFNIRFEGQFNLVGLSLESEARSRR